MRPLFLTLLAATAALAQPGVRLPFDGELRDQGPAGRDAYHPAPRFVAGQAGQALVLDGDRVTVTDDPSLRLAPGLEIDLWVRFDDTPASARIIGKNEEYQLRVDPSVEGANFSFFVVIGGWEPRAQVKIAPVVGQWYHLRAGWDGLVAWLDVDGQRTETPRPAPAAGLRAPLTIGPLDIGPFTGAIDEVRVSSPNAVATYAAHWAFDGTLTDTVADRALAPAAAATFAPGRAGQAVDLRTALTLPADEALDLAPGLVIDCLVRLDELPTSYGYLVVREGQYMLRINSPDEGGQFAFFVNLGTWEPRVTSPVRAEVGVWYRLRAGWDGRQLTLEVNGVPKTTQRAGLAQPSTGELRLGTVAGVLDDLRITNPRPPLLRIAALQQDRAILRAGQDERLYATVENIGTFARAAAAELAGEPGFTVAEPARVELGDLAPGESRLVEWRVRSAEEATYTAAVALMTGDEPVRRVGRTVSFFAEPLMPRPPQVVLDEPATTWYIDSRDGDNNADGLTPATAWRDFTPVNDRTLGPGEQVLLRRGSVFTQELRLRADGAADRWARLGTYGEGARPLIRRDWRLDQRCVLISNPSYLHITGLTVAYAGKGLIVQDQGQGRRGLVIEDCVAHHIEGLYRTGAHGIPEWAGLAGAPGDTATHSAGIAVLGGRPRDVLVRDCETYQCSWGFFAMGENIVVDRVFCHDNIVHNTSPHPAMVQISRSWLTRSLFHAAGWHASAGTMGIMLVNPEGFVIRESTFRAQPDSGSHDQGGIDFENEGNGTLIERCTFEHNAGAAVEVLGLQTPQPRAVEIRGSRFIQNNLAHKLGPSEIYIWGQSPNPEVCCSYGVIEGNGYTLNDGVSWFHNDVPELAEWIERDNTGYATPAELRAAMPLNDHPVAEAGPAVWGDQATIALAGAATDTDTPVGGPLALRWEVIEGPGEATFDPPNAAAPAVTLSQPGDYLLRLVADDGDLWHADTVTAHRLPAGAQTARAWGWATNLDKEGWTDADLGTTLQVFDEQAWPTRAEPIRYVAGGYYIVALDASTTGHLLSPADLNLPAADVDSVRLRLMNSTNATTFRLRLLTDPAADWTTAPTIDIPVTPHDTAPRTYTVPIPALPSPLHQLRLDLATPATPTTGTVRLDYVWLGQGGG